MSTYRLLGIVSLADLRKLPAAVGVVTTEAQGLAAVLLPARKPLAAWLQTRKAEMSGLLEFQKLLERMSASAPVLPAAYGSALMTPEEARALLAAHADELRDSFETYGSLVQFQIEVRWSPEKAMSRFKQDGLFSGLDVALADRDRRAFGAAVQALMEAERQRLALSFADMLRSASRDVVRLPLADENMVLNAAALISREEESVLDRAVESIDAALPDALAIRYLGPLPAVSFATITVVEPEKARLADARAALGVTAASNAAEIKERYRFAIRKAHPDGGDAAAATDAAAALSRAHALALRAALAPRNAKGQPLLLDVRREGDATARNAA